MLLLLLVVVVVVVSSSQFLRIKMVNSKQGEYVAF